MQVSAEVFERMCDALRRDIWMVQAHLQLYWRIQEATKHHIDAIKEAPHFWASMARANLDTAISHLCRVYDQQRTSFNIGLWLETLRDSKRAIIESVNFATMEDFAEEEEQEEEVNHDTDPASKLYVIEGNVNLDQIETDLSMVKANSDPLVKKLHDRRNKVIVHRDRQYLLDGVDGGKAHAMKHVEVQELAKRAFNLLYRYSLTLKLQEMAEFVGAHDFHIVIEALESNKDARRKRMADTDPFFIAQALQKRIDDKRM